jgi:chromosome segregation ATPase
MLRANEDAAVAEAIAILNSDSAFEAFGKSSATSTGSTGFIQLRSRRVRVHAQELSVSQTVKQVLMQAKSPRVEKIASLVQAENVFDEVLTEIDKMLKVIVEEGKADKENLDWCNTERTDNNKELDEKIDEIDTLNQEIDELVTTIDDPETGLKAQIKSTEESLEANINSQKTETTERQEANLLYQEDIKNLVAAESILKKAIKVLRKYYDKLEKRMAAEAGFLQEDPDAPDTWGKYDGQSSKGGDAVTMLEFILESTIKEETEAHADEEDAQHSYEDSMTDLKQKEADYEKAIATLQENLAAAQEELVNKKKDLKATRREGSHRGLFVEDQAWL